MAIRQIINLSLAILTCQVFGRPPHEEFQKDCGVPLSPRGGAASLLQSSSSHRSTSAAGAGDQLGEDDLINHAVATYHAVADGAAVAFLQENESDSTQSLDNHSESSFCDPALTEDIDRYRLSTLDIVEKSKKAFSSLHEVVGIGGVLMISLESRPDRFNYSARLMEEVGIVPHLLPATEAHCASQEQLSSGCKLEDDEGTPAWCLAQRSSARNKEGTGCQSKVEQAIADSHRRALELAQERAHEWTAIFEDDTVPVRPQRWNRAFKKAWARVPETAKIVRLSWCMIARGPGEPTIQTWSDEGDFRLSTVTGFGRESIDYKAGGCTGAYMVHRSIIPDLLALFPCCCAVDCCFEHDLFNRKSTDGNGKTKGEQVLVNLDAWSWSPASNHIEEYSSPQHYGVMKQDRSLISTRSTYASPL